jgi:serine/threonine protein kinase
VPKALQGPAGLLDYELDAKAFALGGSGELWRARRIRSGEEEFILKRIANNRAAGMREAYFGALLGRNNFTSEFVESFEEKGELWLVFRDAGKSLNSFLYDLESKGEGISSFGPSSQWEEAKTTANSSLLIEIMERVLQCVAFIHSLGITHRDIKPSNVVFAGNRFRLIDFGSAVSMESLGSLYGMFGPSQDEETLSYAPPEVLFSNSPFFFPDPKTYDIWSVGVLFLELITGTSHVFQLDDRTRAMLEVKFADFSPEYREKTFLLQALIEYCLYDPLIDRDSGRQALQVRAVSPLVLILVQICTDLDLDQKIESLDPLHIGIPSHECLHLIHVRQNSPSSPLTSLVLVGMESEEQNLCRRSPQSRMLLEKQTKHPRMNASSFGHL